MAKNWKSSKKDDTQRKDLEINISGTGRGAEDEVDSSSASVLRPETVKIQTLEGKIVTITIAE